MSIIIKGEDKPLVCNECPCWDEEYFRCRTKGSWDKCRVYGEPPEWCPITELPETVVDLDGFVPTYTEEETKGKDFHDGVLFVMDLLDELPRFVVGEKDV